MINKDITKLEAFEKANNINCKILQLQAELNYFIKLYQEYQQEIFSFVHDELEEKADGETLQEAE